jgi:hypothetical protein
MLHDGICQKGSQYSKDSHLPTNICVFVQHISIYIDEKRVWCIVTYSSIVQRLNIILNIVDFYVPFLINLFLIYHV